MNLIDLILNVAAVLMWLNWRSIRRDPLNQAPPATLVGTLRRAEPSLLQRWHLLAGISALLIARALFYWQIGPAVNWTPRLNLGVVVIPFRVTLFYHDLMFSLLSFLRALLISYFWLLILASVNRRVADSDPLQKMVLLQLGRVGRWHPLLQIVLPIAAVTVVWMAVSPLLIRMGVLIPAQSQWRVLAQGVMVGAALLFTLKILLPAFLLVYLVNSYIYFGPNPAWDFIELTARNILCPLRKLPLRFRKIDFSPLVGIALILLLLHIIPEYTRAHLVANDLPVWPE